MNGPRFREVPPYEMSSQPASDTDPLAGRVEIISSDKHDAQQAADEKKDAADKRNQTAKKIGGLTALAAAVPLALYGAVDQGIEYIKRREQAGILEKNRPLNEKNQAEAEHKREIDDAVFRDFLNAPPQSAHVDALRAPAVKAAKPGKSAHHRYRLRHSSRPKR